MNSKLYINSYLKTGFSEMTGHQKLFSFKIKLFNSGIFKLVML